jgi:hypothetical protein
MVNEVPFQKEAQLSSALDYLVDASLVPNPSPKSLDLLSPIEEALPDYPNIPLSDTARLTTFLKRSLCAPDLENMAPHLWVMSTQSLTNVNPLHHQLVKGRSLILTEDPRLHLVWVSDRIFLKPLPTFLLSHAFWHHYLLPTSTSSPLPPADRDMLARSARGYLRTYAYLIQHPCDFSLALRHALIPPHVTPNQFFLFAARFRDIRDEECSSRYAYGELRLTRLNFYAKFILRRWHFQHVHTAYGEYFSRFYGPLLFIFTVLSLILNALQVEMAVEQTIGSSAGGGGSGTGGGRGDPLPLGNWIPFWQVSRWAAVMTIVVVGSLAIGLVGLLAWFHADEWKFAIKDRLRTKRVKRRAEAMAVDT